LNLPGDVQFVCTIGQLGLRKATDVVLRAAIQIAGKAPNIHWLIVGERTSGKEESLEYERQLHAVAAKPSLAGRVHFLGSRRDVSRLLNECVLLVHAARQEPLGRVLLEAAASGLPIVATDVGGTREIFRTHADGAILVPAGDPLALADSALELLRDEPRRQAFAVAARQRAFAGFDIHRASERLIAQYRQVLGP
jgi:glycosyltransferase involved in cell wall biosynthesis